jgi:hypothetical protein
MSVQIIERWPGSRVQPQAALIRFELWRFARHHNRCLIATWVVPIETRLEASPPPALTFAKCGPINEETSMNVTNVGAAPMTAGQFSQAYSDGTGPLMLAFLKDTVEQGQAGVGKAEQSFGDENPAKKAVNMELA